MAFYEPQRMEQKPQYNESTTGADASVEALKLYHMKLTLAYSSFTCSAC